MFVGWMLLDDLGFLKFTIAAGARAEFGMPIVAKLREMIYDHAMVRANSSREEHQTEEKGDGDGPYYDAPVETVAEEGADREAL